METDEGIFYLNSAASPAELRRFGRNLRGERNHDHSEPRKPKSIVDQEQATAERYRWWGVYLIREKRRLQAIADAIAHRAEAGAQPSRRRFLRQSPPDWR